MGKCSYCGEKAGMFRSVHKECKERADGALEAIAGLAAGVAVHGKDPGAAKRQIASLMETARLPKDNVRRLFRAAFEVAVEEALSDGVLSREEEHNLVEYQKSFGLTQEELNKNRSHLRLVEAAVLRDVLEGKLPNRVQLDGDVHFNFQKSERLVWAFPVADYYEERTRRQYVGGSSGVRIRIMKGVYYSTSSFRGHPVETQHLVHVDVGCLAITNKHLYFGGGQRKSFRINYNKIVTFTPFDDGLGVMRDAQTAKPQIFGVGDGWFIYNLVTNLAELQLTPSR